MPGLGEAQPEQIKSQKTKEGVCVCLKVNVWFCEDQVELLTQEKGKFWMVAPFSLLTLGWTF